MSGTRGRGGDALTSRGTTRDEPETTAHSAAYSVSVALGLEGKPRRSSGKEGVASSAQAVCGRPTETKKALTVVAFGRLLPLEFALGEASRFRVKCAGVNRHVRLWAEVQIRELDLRVKTESWPRA